jgi:hypothetical protein
MRSIPQRVSHTFVSAHTISSGGPEPPGAVLRRFRAGEEVVLERTSETDDYPLMFRIRGDASLLISRGVIANFIPGFCSHE